MSIKGIDAQIMLSRTQEMSRDTAGQARRGELFQSQLSAQSKEQAAHDTRSVVRAEHAEKADIHQDAGGGGGTYGESGQKKHKNPDESEEQLFAGLKEERKIDIKI